MRLCRIRMKFIITALLHYQEEHTGRMSFPSPPLLHGDVHRLSLGMRNEKEREKTLTGNSIVA